MYNRTYTNRPTAVVDHHRPPPFVDHPTWDVRPEVWPSAGDPMVPPEVALRARAWLPSEIRERVRAHPAALWPTVLLWAVEHPGARDRRKEASGYVGAYEAARAMLASRPDTARPPLNGVWRQVRAPSMRLEPDVFDVREAFAQDGSPRRFLSGASYTGPAMEGLIWVDSSMAAGDGIGKGGVGMRRGVGSVYVSGGATFPANPVPLDETLLTRTIPPVMGDMTLERALIAGGSIVPPRIQPLLAAWRADPTPENTAALNAASDAPGSTQAWRVAAAKWVHAYHAQVRAHAMGQVVDHMRPLLRSSDPLVAHSTWRAFADVPPSAHPDAWLTLDVSPGEVADMVERAEVKLELIRRGGGVGGMPTTVPRDSALATRVMEDEILLRIREQVRMAMALVDPAALVTYSVDSYAFYGPLAAAEYAGPGWSTQSEVDAHMARLVDWREREARVLAWRNPSTGAVAPEFDPATVSGYDAEGLEHTREHVDWLYGLLPDEFEAFMAALTHYRVDGGRVAAELLQHEAKNTIENMRRVLDDDLRAVQMPNLRAIIDGGYVPGAPSPTFGDAATYVSDINGRLVEVDNAHIALLASLTDYEESRDSAKYIIVTDYTDPADDERMRALKHLVRLDETAEAAYNAAGCAYYIVRQACDTVYACMRAVDALLQFTSAFASSDPTAAEARYALASNMLEYIDVLADKISVGRGPAAPGLMLETNAFLLRCGAVEVGVTDVITHWMDPGVRLSASGALADLVAELPQLDDILGVPPTPASDSLHGLTEAVHFVVDSTEPASQAFSKDLTGALMTPSGLPAVSIDKMIIDAAMSVDTFVAHTAAPAPAGVAPVGVVAPAPAGVAPAGVVAPGTPGTPAPGAPAAATPASATPVTATPTPAPATPIPAPATLTTLAPATLATLAPATLATLAPAPLAVPVPIPAPGTVTLASPSMRIPHKSTPTRPLSTRPKKATTVFSPSSGKTRVLTPGVAGLHTPTVATPGVSAPTSTTAPGDAPTSTTVSAPAPAPTTPPGTPGAATTPVAGKKKRRGRKGKGPASGGGGGTP